MSLGPEVGVASVLIVPDLSKFEATLVAEVTAATRASSAATVQATRATQLSTAASVRGAAAATGLADSHLVTARAAEVDATAHAELANVFGAVAASAKLEQKALLEAAAAHETFARGAGATGLSLFGLRGATLAASTPFLIGAAVVTAAAKSLHEFSDEAEAAARVNAILGAELGHSSEEWAKNQAAIGLSAEAALKYEGAIAQVFKNVKVADEQNAQFSENLVRRAVDVAARSNAPVTSVLRAFQLALSGNLRGLRQYVPAISAAIIAQRALADTGKDTKASLSEQELVLARYEVLMQKSANQAGAFKQRQGDLAAQSKILKSNLANVAAELGGPLAHAIAGDIIAVNKLFDAFHKLSTIHVGGGFSLLNVLFPPTLIPKIIDELTGVKKGLDDLPPGLQGVQGAAAGAASGVNTLGAAVAGLIGPMDAARQAALALQSALAGLGVANTQLLRLQAGGAPLGTQLPAAQKALDAAAKAVAAADALPARKGKATAQKQALQAELAARGQVTSIQSQIDAQARKGAAAAAKAGKTAQQILDEEDQRLQTELDIARTENDIAQAKAGLTKSLVDDVAADQARVRLLTIQLKQAQQIHDTTTRIQTIQQLTLERINTRTTIKQLQDQQRQNRRDRIVNAADARVQSAQLDADLAETLGHKRDQISALKRENVALEAEKKLWAGNTIKQKEIRNQIAQNNATIREIKKGLAERNNLGNELAFSFLQAQQGFAASVMGNLLSQAVVTGTVGGTGGGGAISTSTPGPAGFATAVHQRPPHTAVTTAAATAAVRGPTAGQASTQIAVLREILTAVRIGTGRTSHPEAVQQYAWTGTEMLNTGW